MNFFLTNRIVFDLFLNHEEFDLNWETVTSFINDYFKFDGKVLSQSFVSSCNVIKKKISGFGKNKHHSEKQKLLQQIFIPPTKLKKTSRKNYCNNFQDEAEIWNLEASFWCAQPLSADVYWLARSIRDKGKFFI